jgi:hypothetical protein
LPHDGSRTVLQYQRGATIGSKSQALDDTTGNPRRWRAGLLGLQIEFPDLCASDDYGRSIMRILRGINALTCDEAEIVQHASRFVAHPPSAASASHDERGAVRWSYDSDRRHVDLRVTCSDRHCRKALCRPHPD